MFEDSRGAHFLQSSRWRHLESVPLVVGQPPRPPAVLLLLSGPLLVFDCNETVSPSEITW